MFFEKRDLSYGYDIINWIYIGNKSGPLSWRVGEILPSEEFTIRDDWIVWNRGLKKVQNELSPPI